MKHSIINPLLVAVGIALAVVGMGAGSAYINTQKQIRADERRSVLLDRLYCDQQIGSALKALHGSEIAGATRRLDLALCCDILRIDSEIAPGDDQIREFAQLCFVGIGRARPKISEGVTGTNEASSPEQLAAQRILAKAGGSGEAMAARNQAGKSRD